MNAHYFSTGLCMGSCHYWSRWTITDPAGRWYVAGMYAAFAKSGFAVIDDFGNLVEVAE